MRGLVFFPLVFLSNALSVLSRYKVFPTQGSVARTFAVLLQGSCKVQGPWVLCACRLIIKDRGSCAFGKASSLFDACTQGPDHKRFLIILLFSVNCISANPFAQEMRQALRVALPIFCSLVASGCSLVAPRCSLVPGCSLLASIASGGLRNGGTMLTWSIKKFCEQIWCHLVDMYK